MSRSSISLCVVWVAMAASIPTTNAQGPITYQVSELFAYNSQVYEVKMKAEVNESALKADSLLRSTIEKIWNSSYVQYALQIPRVRSAFECVSKKMKPTNAQMTEMVYAVVKIISNIQALNIEVAWCLKNSKLPGAPKPAQCVIHVTGAAAQSSIRAQQVLVLNFLRIYATFKSFPDTVNKCASLTT